MLDMQGNLKHHIPVMTTEVLKLLNLKKDGIYIDGTIGAGGHTFEILSKLSPKGKVIGLDRDIFALELSLSLIHISEPTRPY